MAAYAEGLNILHRANVGLRPRTEDAETSPLREPQYYRYDIDVAQVAEVWRRGSVVASWLLDLTAAALDDDPGLAGFTGRVSDSGEGRWTVLAAVDEGAPAHVLSAALFNRFAVPGPGRLRRQAALRHAQAVRRALGATHMMPDMRHRSGRRYRPTTPASPGATCASCSPRTASGASDSIVRGGDLLPRLLQAARHRRDGAPARRPGRAGRPERPASTPCSRGERINATEDRAVLHVALRMPRDRPLVVDGVDVVGDVHATLDRMAGFADRVRSGDWRGFTGRPLRQSREHRHRRVRPRARRWPTRRSRPTPSGR